MMGIILWLVPLETVLGFLFAFSVFLWKKRVNIATPAGIAVVILFTWDGKHHLQLLVFFLGFALLLILVYWSRFPGWLRNP
jgi:hypothetical protein